MKNKNLLIIFTRNPEPGKCKTRLAKTIGDNAALEIYKFLLEHTVNITKDLNCSKTVYYSESITVNDIWSNHIYKKQVQIGNDLGERMLNAFQGGFNAGYENIIIIGSDMYELATNDIQTAFDCLKENDFVLGPAKDGGYYLLGMKSLKNKKLFQNKDWGTNTVLKSTLQDLKNDRITLLSERNDVDTYDDIKDNIIFKKFYTRND